MFGANGNEPAEPSQGELFSDLSGVSKKIKRTKLSLGKVALNLSYENIIILSIGLIMLLIVCYSLGVERGKYIIQAKAKNTAQRQTEGLEQSRQELPEEQKQEEQKMPTIKPQQPKRKKLRIKAAQTPAAVEAPVSLPYIQVATFRTDKYAKAEIERLNNKGYQVFLRSRGKFKVVCVGGYSNKEEAFRSLKALRKIYSDCFLRHK